MVKFLINPGMEKAFWVMPKNPEAIKVTVSKYEQIQMKLLHANTPQAKSKGKHYQWDFLPCIQIIGKGLISLVIWRARNKQVKGQGPTRKMGNGLEQLYYLARLLVLFLWGGG